MDLNHLMSMDGARIAGLIAWTISMLASIYIRRWRLACAFACLTGAALLRNPDARWFQLGIVISLFVIAVMLLFSDIRQQTSKRRRNDRVG